MNVRVEFRVTVLIIHEVPELQTQEKVFRTPGMPETY